MKFFYYGQPAFKGTRGAFFINEGSNKRYVNSLDIKKRKYQKLTSLPNDIDKIIWRYTEELNCIERNWGQFIYHLTLNQLYTLRHASGIYIRPKHYIRFALENLSPTCRIYRKALRQLSNY